MDKAIELIVVWIQKNLKNPRLYAGIIVLVLVLALVFPYIDANFLFYSRIEKRIAILESVVGIDTEKVAQNPELWEEYNAILSEIKQQRELSLSGVFSSDRSATGILWVKVLSGGLLSWVLAVCMVFMGNFKTRAARMVAVVFFVVLGIGLGYAGTWLPIFFNPCINYIFYPICQLVVLIAVVNGRTKKPGTN